MLAFRPGDQEVKAQNVQFVIEDGSIKGFIDRLQIFWAMFFECSQDLRLLAGRQLRQFMGI